MINGIVLVLTLRHTGVVQLVVGCLTIRQFMIVIDGNFLGNAVVVGTIVCDVQLTVAINQRQVTIAIETTRMTGTQRDKVTVIDIIDRGGGIAVYRVDVGSRRNGTELCVTTGKHGIMDDDTRLV